MARNDGEGEQPLAAPEAWRIRIFDVSRASPGRGGANGATAAAAYSGHYHLGLVKLSNAPFILSEYMILNTSVSLAAVS